MMDITFKGKKRGLFIYFCIIQIAFMSSIESYSFSFEPNSEYEFNSLSKSGNINYQFEQISSYDTGFGIIKDLDIRNRYLFAAVNRGGLVILDISNLSSPTFVSNYDQPKKITSDRLWSYYGGLTAGIFVRDNIAYLGDGLNGLVILNISDPYEPRLLSHLDTIGISGVTVHGDYLFGKLHADEIPIINIEDPSNPYLAYIIDSSSISIDVIFDFVIYNELIYIVTPSDLIILNIEDPTNPIEISRILGGGGSLAEIYDEFLYVYSYSYSGYPTPNSILVFDISNPDNPIFLSEYFVQGINGVQSFSIRNSTMYMSSENEVLAFDITNRTSPQFLGEIGPLGYGTSYKKLFLVDENNDLYKKIVFCSDQNQGLVIFNFSNPVNPVRISQYDMGSKTVSITTTEEYGYIIKNNEFPSLPSYMETISWSDSLQIESVNEYTSNDSMITDIDIMKGICFMSKFDYGFDILNLSEPKKPQILSKNNHSDAHNYWSDKVIYSEENHLLFLSNAKEGFAILDVSNLSNPTLLYANNPSDSIVSDIFIENNLLFLADVGGFGDSGGFVIINITDPVSPNIISHKFLNDKVHSLYCEGNLLYVATRFSYIKIYDVSNPTNPMKMGDLPATLLSPAHEIIVNNSIAYIARDANGLIAIDVSNIRKPKILTTYRNNYSGISYDVTVFGKYLFLADGWDGLEILELIPPKIPKNLYLLITIGPPVSGFLVMIGIIVNIQTKKKKESNVTLN